MAEELTRARPRDPRSLERNRRARARTSCRTCKPGSASEFRRSVQDSGVTVEPKDVARETAILADRCDISEEIVRLRAHLSQFHEIIDEPQSAGRKLEFVAQEIGREINTIGSKASDVQISRSVVEVKALLEKIRELVQNVE